MGIRRKYTKEFKESAIELYHSSGKSANEIAHELGIHQENLSRWLRESKEAETKKIKAFPGQGNPRDEELNRLRKEVADLRERNEILKKAMAFFVEKSPR
ncbi:MAG: transposase [Treponema sp.]|nr:transposase [Treponema sp.]